MTGPIKAGGRRPFVATMMLSVRRVATPSSQQAKKSQRPQRNFLQNANLSFPGMQAATVIMNLSGHDM